jgi:superfamily I DNA and RNA helicase
MVKSISRNKIFTAMTRARYAVWLMGTNEIDLYEKEIDMVKSKNYVLEFIYPTKVEMEQIKTYGEMESESERKIKNVVKDISALSKTNPQLAKKLLTEMLNSLGDSE